MQFKMESIQHQNQSPRFALIWQDVNFTVGKPITQRLFSILSCGLWFRKERKRALINNKGVIRQGELVALMGPSGAGKSTLVKCLTRGVNHVGFEGLVFVQGVPEGEQVRARYINQNEKEHLISSLTVSESLRYASQFKNRSATRIDHERYVKEYLDYLKLTTAKNTRVEACSGGQTKRLAVGLELITVDKPHFLFLDEPSSGLDSNTGEDLIELLARCVKDYNMAIIATIHQPKPSIFMKFSRVLMLAGDGHTIYNGRPEDLSEILRKCGESCEKKINSSSSSSVDINIEDKFVGEPGSTFDSCSELAIKVASLRPKQEGLDDSLCQFMIEKTAAEILQPGDEPEDNIGRRKMSEGLCSTGADFSFASFFTLLQRTALVTLRDGKFILIRFALHIVVGLVLAALYYNHQDIGTADGCIPTNSSVVSNNSGFGVDEDLILSAENIKFQFFSLLFLLFAAIMPTVLTFPSEIKLFLNEYFNGYYTTASYYISKTLVEIPLQLLLPYMFSSSLYYFTNQPGDWKWIIFCSGSRFWLFIFTTLMCGFIAQGLGLLFGILCVRSFNNAIIVSSSALLFLSLFSGFFVRVSEMTIVAEKISYLSFVRYGVESIIISIFGDGRCSSPSQKSFIIDQYVPKDHDIQYNFIMLLVHLLVIRLLALVILKEKASNIIGRFRRKVVQQVGKLYQCCCSPMSSSREQLDGLDN